MDYIIDVLWANRRPSLANAQPVQFIPPVNEERPFGQQPRGDLSELGGLSQVISHD